MTPHNHPRRLAEHIERQLAERGLALSRSLTAPDAAKRMGITTLRAEQIAAKYGYVYRNHSTDY